MKRVRLHVDGKWTEEEKRDLKTICRKFLGFIAGRSSMLDKKMRG